MVTTRPIIIVFEPDRRISGVLRVEFSHREFDVLVAVSAKEAEVYAARIVANLVVLGTGRAPLSAYEACARIRRRDGYAARPIVLTVGEVSARISAAAELAGASTLLAKPYSVLDLFRAVAQHSPPSDLLLSPRYTWSGIAALPQAEWKLRPSLEWPYGGDSALSRNGSLLPILRRGGKTTSFASPLDGHQQ